MKTPNNEGKQNANKIRQPLIKEFRSKPISDTQNKAMFYLTSETDDSKNDLASNLWRRFLEPVSVLCVTGM